MPEALPLIRADASLIEQAVGNVVNNVVSHAPEGTRLVIDAIVTQQSVSIRATDDGPGIQAEIMPRAFEKFVQGRTGNGRSGGKSGGNGLGLAIEKGIGAAHGDSVGQRRAWSAARPDRALSSGRHPDGGRIRFAERGRDQRRRPAPSDDSGGRVGQKTRKPPRRAAFSMFIAMEA